MCVVRCWWRLSRDRSTVCAVCDVRSDSCGRALTSASKHVVVAEVLNPRRIFIVQCERGVLRPRPTVAHLWHYYYRKVELVIVKTKKRWSGGRRWLESAAMEIFDCVDCFHGRPRLRVREPRTPSGKYHWYSFTTPLDGRMPASPPSSPAHPESNHSSVGSVNSFREGKIE